MTARQSVIPADKLDLLDSTTLAQVATVVPGGEPPVNPVWFNWDGTHLRFRLSPQRQKYRNLERDSRIAISIVDPANPYRYLEIRGRVVRFEPDPDLSFLNSVAKKYMGVDEFPNPPAERMAAVVEPERVSQMG